MKKSVAFFVSAPELVEKVFGSGRKERIAALSHVYPEIITKENFAEHAEQLCDIQAIFSTWGMWELTEEQLKSLPKLEALFYAAGATDGFSPQLLRNNIRVFSAWRANARPVAEFSFAQIMLSVKGFYRNNRQIHSPQDWHGQSGQKVIGPGAYHEIVGLLGDGEIVQYMRKFFDLTDIDLHIVPTFDPHLSQQMTDVFNKAIVVSNHLPNRQDNKECITYEMLKSMREGATFVNTGRGTQVDLDGLITVAKERQDLTFLLDVTDPVEPPAEGSLLYSLPNVYLSAHIAGSANNEVLRMADYMIDEYIRWENDEPVQHEIVLEKLRL